METFQRTDPNPIPRSIRIAELGRDERAFLEHRASRFQFLFYKKRRKKEEKFFLNNIIYLVLIQFQKILEPILESYIYTSFKFRARSTWSIENRRNFVSNKKKKKSE